MIPMIDRTYLDQFTTENLKRMLVVKVDFKALEGIVLSAIEDFSALEALKQEGKLDFGSKVSRKRFKELFGAVREDINSFLGFPDARNNPTYSLFDDVVNDSVFRLAAAGIMSVGFLGAAGLLWMNEQSYFKPLLVGGITSFLFIRIWKEKPPYSHYTTITQEMTLIDPLETDLVSTAGHEYTHHLLRKSVFKPAGIIDQGKLSAFEEGISRGAENRVGELFATRTGNRAYRFDAMKNARDDLLRAYLTISRETKQEPHQAILTAANAQGYTPEFIQKKPWDNHSIGTAALSVLAAERGDGVYQDALHGRLIL